MSCPPDEAHDLRESIHATPGQENAPRRAEIVEPPAALTILQAHAAGERGSARDHLMTLSLHVCHA
jgi:hypothetical protein